MCMSETIRRIPKNPANMISNHKPSWDPWGSMAAYGTHGGPWGRMGPIGTHGAHGLHGRIGSKPAGRPAAAAHGGRAAGGRRRGATRYYSIHKECIVSITRYSWASRYGPYCGNKNKYGTASPRRRPRTLPAKF